MKSTLTEIAEAVDMARKRLLWALSHVPEDRLAWSPAPTAKTTMQIVGHVTSANRFFLSVLENSAPQDATAPDGDVPTTREEAVTSIDATTDALLDAIRSLKPEDLEAKRTTPMGEISVSFVLRIAPLHTFGHAAQIEYLQSCWGDTDFHWND